MTTSEADDFDHELAADLWQRIEELEARRALLPEDERHSLVFDLLCEAIRKLEAARGLLLQE
jgi:hypothetical protein